MYQFNNQLNKDEIHRTLLKHGISTCYPVNNKSKTITISSIKELEEIIEYVKERRS